MTPLSDLNTDLILTLDALLEDRNITHAAARLGISQPAMSARLARLRAIFGEKLFIPSPNGRGILPTPRAESLRPQVTQVLQGISAMLEPTNFDSASSSRTFVIALHENPALMLGADLLNQLSALAPGIRLRFALPDTDRLSEHLESGEIDLYIGVDAIAHDAWIKRKLFDDEFATAQRKEHSRGTLPFDLSGYCALSHLVVSADGEPFTGSLDRALADLGHQRSVVMSVQSYAMAPPIVAGTDLLCTLPGRMLQRFTQSLDIFPPPLPLDPITISMYWHARNNHDPANVWLRALLLKVAGVQR